MPAMGRGCAKDSPTTRWPLIRRPTPERSQIAAVLPYTTEFLPHGTKALIMRHYAFDFKWYLNQNFNLLSIRCIYKLSSSFYNLNLENQKKIIKIFNMLTFYWNIFQKRCSLFCQKRQFYAAGLLLLQRAAGAAADAAVETEPNQLAFIAPTQYRPIFVSFCQFRFVLAHHQETLSSHMVCTGSAVLQSDLPFARSLNKMLPPPSSWMRKIVLQEAQQSPKWRQSGVVQYYENKKWTSALKKLLS